MNQEDLFTQDPSTELVVTAGEIQQMVLEARFDEIQGAHIQDWTSIEKYINEREAELRHKLLEINPNIFLSENGHIGIVHESDNDLRQRIAGEEL